MSHGPKPSPSFFLGGERGMFGVWHVFFVDEGFLWGVRSRSLLKFRGATVYTGWGGVCRQLHGMAKPLSCCLDFFRKSPLWAVVLSVHGQTYYPPRTEKDAKKVKKGKKSKKDTADYWFFTWLETYNLSQLQQLIPRQGMRWRSIELHGLTFHHMAMQRYAALQWTRASFQCSI